VDVTDGSRDVFPAATSGGAAVGGQAAATGGHCFFCVRICAFRTKIKFFAKPAILGYNTQIKDVSPVTADLRGGIWMKIVGTLLCVVLCLTLLGAPALASAGYRVYFEEAEVIFDAPPVQINNRLLVPVRAISEVTGAEVIWDGRTATVHRGSDTLVLGPNLNFATFNDVPIALEVSPVLRDQRIFLPLRFVTQWLGLHVEAEGRTITLTEFPQMQTVTMTAPRGNTNANLNNRAHRTLWENRVFSSELTGELNSLDLQTGESEILMTTGDPRFFNIWENRLFVNLNVSGNLQARENDFVEIDRSGNILQTLQHNVGYSQIHNGWLYFVSESDNQLHRRLLSGGETQALGIFPQTNYTELEFVITDQYIFVNNGWTILKTELDGTERRQIFSIPSFANYCTVTEDKPITGLDFADGLLFFSIYSRSGTPFIVAMNADGTGLRIIVEDGASRINVVGGWIYYNLVTTQVVSDVGAPMGVPTDIARIRPDGSSREILAQGWARVGGYHSPTVMPNGDVYYAQAELWSTSWHRVVD